MRVSHQEKIKLAKEYIDKQIATMKTHGCAPQKLPRGEYQAMINQAAKAILK